MQPNIPYVKQFNEFGECTNPIELSYVSTNPVRRQRKAMLSKVRFHGESKNHHLTVIATGKFKRVRQRVDGKTIEHYIQA